MEEKEIACINCIHFNLGTYQCSLDKDTYGSHCDKFKQCNKESDKNETGGQ